MDHKDQSNKICIRCGQEIQAEIFDKVCRKCRLKEFRTRYRNYGRHH